MFTVFLRWALATFSPLTFCFALFVISGAAYLRQLMNLVLEVLRVNEVAPFVWGGFALMGAALVFLLRRAGTTTARGLLAATIFAGGLVASLELELAVERVHLLLFGLLGFFAARDAAGRHGYRTAKIVGVWLFCLTVAALDEGLQYFLPYRVGDPRDLLFGALGGLWGSALHAAGANANPARSRTFSGGS